VKIVFPGTLSPQLEDGIRRKILEAVEDKPEVAVLFSPRRKVQPGRR
jgi:hypothetical protein